MTTKLLLSGGRVFRQKISSLGTLRAAVVGKTQGLTVDGVLALGVYGASGRNSVWNLPGISNNVQEACCCLWPGGVTVAWRDYPSNQTVLSDFTLTDPFNSGPVPIGEFRDGNGSSRRAELVRMPSGEVVCLTDQWDADGLWGAVRSTAGAWQDSGLLLFSGKTNTSYEFSCAREPWNQDGIAAVLMFDGSQGVDLGRFYVQNGRLLLRESRAFWLSRASVNGVISNTAANGEDPAFYAVADARNNRVLISTTGLEPGPINQTAFPKVIGFGPDLVPKLVQTGTDYVVSILDPIPISVTDRGITMAYFPGKPQTNLVVVQPGSLAITTTLAPVAVAACEDAAEFIGRTAAGTIVLVQMDDSAPMPPVPQPPPAPPPVPAPVPVPVPVPPPPPAPIPPPNTPPSESLISIQLNMGVLATDREDGNVGPKVEWYSSLVGKLGTGASISVGLVTKTQTIRYRLTDSGGLTVEKSFTITF